MSWSPPLRLLTRPDILLFDYLIDGDHYTFAGYPCNRSRTQGFTQEYNLFTYTGSAASTDEYSRLRYDRSVHVLIKFYREKSFSFRRQSIQTAPHPRGISGGGVFAWPKDAEQRPGLPKLKLAGIALSYHKSEHCMSATRINICIAAIARNHPRLAKTILQLGDDETQKPNVMVWYEKEEWDELLLGFDDAYKMPSTWIAWRQAALKCLEEAGALGTILTPVLVTAKEISGFCRERGVKNTSQARIELAFKKYATLVFEKLIDQTQ